MAQVWSILKRWLASIYRVTECSPSARRGHGAPDAHPTCSRAFPQATRIAWYRLRGTCSGFIGRPPPAIGMRGRFEPLNRWKIRVALNSDKAKNHRRVPPSARRDR